MRLSLAELEKETAGVVVEKALQRIQGGQSEDDCHVHMDPYTGEGWYVKHGIIIVIPAMH